MKRTDFYEKYFRNLSPSTFSVRQVDDEIVIGNIMKHKVQKANAGAYLAMAQQAKGIAPKSFEALDERLAKKMAGPQYTDEKLFAKKGALIKGGNFETLTTAKEVWDPSLWNTLGKFIMKHLKETNPDKIYFMDNQEPMYWELDVPLKDVEQDVWSKGVDNGFMNVMVGKNVVEMNDYGFEAIYFTDKSESSFEWIKDEEEYEKWEDENYKKGGKTDNWIGSAVDEMEEKGTVGAFTKKAKKAGMSTVQFAKEVLSKKNEKKFDLKTRRQAQFMKNVNPQMFRNGGTIIDEDGSNMPPDLFEVFNEYDDNNDAYFEAERLRQKANEIGYDFDYDLSGAPTEFWTIKLSRGGTTKTFKPGDMWSEDFDYQGMLEYGKSINSKTSDKEIEKYAESLEDVNYHTLAKPLFDYQVAKSGDDKRIFLNFMSEFRRKLSDELEQQGGKRLGVDEVYKYKEGGSIDEKLATEHAKEAKRKKATITNMASNSGPDFIESKTTEGILYSEIDDGKVSHEWEYDKMEYGGFIESMGPSYDDGMERLEDAFRDWINGPMTTGDMVGPAIDDIMKDLYSNLKSIANKSNVKLSDDDKMARKSDVVQNFDIYSLKPGGSKTKDLATTIQSINDVMADDTYALKIVQEASSGSFRIDSSQISKKMKIYATPFWGDDKFTPIDVREYDTIRRDYELIDSIALALPDDFRMETYSDLMIYYLTNIAPEIRFKIQLNK